MFETAYHAEEIAFTAQVIKRSFCNTGIFPWNPDLILGKAKQNAGDEITATKQQYINVMKQAAEIKICPKATATKLKQGRAKLLSLVMFTPYKILQFDNEKEKAKNKHVEEKKTRKTKLRRLHIAETVQRMLQCQTSC